MITKKLFIVGKESEALFLAKNKITNPDDIICCFCVEAKIVLDSYQITNFFPTEFIKKKLDFNTLGIDNLNLLEKITYPILDFLHKKLGNEIRCHTLPNHFYLKNFLDTTTSTIILLEELFTVINPERIFAFSYNHIDYSDPTFSEQSSLYAILSTFFREKYAVHWFNTSKRVLDHKVFKQTLSEFKNNFVFPKMQNDSTLPNILLIDNRFDVQTITTFYKNNFNFTKFFPLSNKYFIFSDNKTINVTRIDKRNVDISSLITDILEKIQRFQIPVISYINQCIKSYFENYTLLSSKTNEKVKKYLYDNKISWVLLSSTRSSGYYDYILNVSRSMDIPIVSYQEGGGAGYWDYPTFNTDIKNSTYFLSYGIGVKNSPFIVQPEKVMDIGSIYLTQKFELIKNNSSNYAKNSNEIINIFVVLDNIKTGLYQHYPYNGGLFSIAYNKQIYLLDLIKKLQIQKVNFIIKTIPSRRKLYSKYVDNKTLFIETKPIHTICNQADGFIMESPTTVLMESMVANKPILLLAENSDNSVKLLPEAIELLKNSISLNFHQENFGEEIQNFIHSIQSQSLNPIENNLFVNDYILQKDTLSKLEHFLSSKGFLGQYGIGCSA